MSTRDWEPLQTQPVLRALSALIGTPHNTFLILKYDLFWKEVGNLQFILLKAVFLKVWISCYLLPNHLEGLFKMQIPVETVNSFRVSIVIPSFRLGTFNCCIVLKGWSGMVGSLRDPFKGHRMKTFPNSTRMWFALFFAVLLPFALLMENQWWAKLLVPYQELRQWKQIVLLVIVLPTVMHLLKKKPVSLKNMLHEELSY